MMPIGHLLAATKPMLSMTHMVVLFIVVLVIFGPHKLPELARGLGKLMAEFRKASTDFKSAFEQEMRDIERQALQAERKKAAEAVAAASVAADQPATLATQADTRNRPSHLRRGFSRDGSAGCHSSCRICAALRWRRRSSRTSSTRLGSTRLRPANGSDIRSRRNTRRISRSACA